MFCRIAAAMEDITTSIRTNASSPEDADVADANGGGTDKREPRGGRMGNAVREEKGGRGTAIKGPANDKRGGSEAGANEDDTEGVGTGSDVTEGIMVRT